MIIFALDNIRSAFNVGSVFRTLDGAFGKHTFLILGGFTPDGQSPEVSKTSLGAEGNVPWIRSDKLLPKLARYKSQNYKVISIEESNSAEKFEFHLPLLKQEDNLIFVFGSEVSGISKDILDISDKILKLPMNGIKNSLNISSTVAIVAYSLIL